jgi:hypothetical protein
MAFGPGPDEYNRITHRRCDSKMNMVTYFGSAEGAMKAIDRKWPYNKTRKMKDER